MCRALLAELADEWGMSAEQAEVGALIVSELVTNAVNASTHGQTGALRYLAGQPMKIAYRLTVDDAGTLRIDVWDQASGAPVVGRAALEAESGRGMELVEALASRWGWNLADTGWKCVWAEVRAGG